jgi:hypothetical protein
MPKIRPDDPERKTEKITGVISKDAYDRIRWAASVTRKSIGNIINDLIIDHINEPPKVNVDEVFKK